MGVCIQRGVHKLGSPSEYNSVVSIMLFKRSVKGPSIPHIAFPNTLPCMDFVSKGTDLQSSFGP